MLQNFGSDDRMNLHLFEFLGRQLARFRKNVLRHSELSDVMQEGCRPQGVQLRVAQAHLFGNLDRIVLNAAEMIMGGLVLGFDGQGECFNGTDVKSVHLSYVNFFHFQPAYIEPIGAIQNPCRR